MDSIGKKTYSRSSQSITNLPCEECSSCSISNNYLLEKEEEIVEPTCCEKIIDEMPNSVSPDMSLV
jgi:hypothetical protein